VSPVCVSGVCLRCVSPVCVSGVTLVCHSCVPLSVWPLCACGLSVRVVCLSVCSLCLCLSVRVSLPKQTSPCHYVVGRPISASWSYLRAARRNSIPDAVFVEMGPAFFLIPPGPTPQGTQQERKKKRKPLSQRTTNNRTARSLSQMSQMCTSQCTLSTTLRLQQTAYH